MALILSGLLVKKYGRPCQEKSKSPNHCKFLKEISRISKPLTTAENCVNILFQFRFFVIRLL